MAKETTKEPVSTVSEKIIVMIDPKRTNGGIRINGKLKVGKVICNSQDEADDLLRIQEEYAASFAKLTDPSVVMRNQSIETTRRAFMADPVTYGQHPRFTKQFGLSTPFQMGFVPEADLIEWQQERMGLYNY